MQAEGLRRLMEAIKAGGGEARFVGGCVRDALSGRAVRDVDLAVDLPPEKTAEILAGAGLKVVPTGIAHGTVTAVADHKGYEITTLRRDVETDGRRAKVVFTDDWQADAARRDFTFNALYADDRGKIFDYFEGQADLARGHVRFIGQARDRIREDVLRILRFFRFHAWFGLGPPDEAGLVACQELSHLLPQLSAERVWREISKLLAAQNPLPAWQIMQGQGILVHVLPEATEVARLERLLTVTHEYDAQTSSLVRLAALLKPEASAVAVAQRLRLSNKEAGRLEALRALPVRLRESLEAKSLRRVLYASGAAEVRDALCLLGAQEPGLDLQEALAEIGRWEKPLFPVQGSDILKLGVAAGPAVGERLRAVEAWWVEQDFRPVRAECLARAKSLDEKA